MKARLQQFFLFLEKSAKKVNKYFNLDFKLLGQVLVSFLGSAGLFWALQIKTSSVITDSMFTVVVFALLLFINRRLTKLSKGEHILQVCFAILLAIIGVVGAQLDTKHEIFWTLGTVVKIFCLTFTFLPVFNYLIAAIKKCKLANFSVKKPRKLFWITFGLIVFFNFLVFLALFPGVYNYDVGAQVIQILRDDVQMNTHFSILFSLLVALPINFGQTVFHSPEIGFAIFAFLQMLVLDFVAAKVAIFAVKHTKNSYLYLFSLLFFSFFPFFTVMTISSAQDTLFGAMLALTLLNLFEMVEDDHYWQKWYKPVSLMIFILLLCLFRNNGLYAIIFTIPAILILLRSKKRWMALGCVLIPLIIFKIITGPIYNSLGIVRIDNYKEMASVPSQQLSRVYYRNRGAFSEDDLAKLFTYYDSAEGFDVYPYQPMLADPAKAFLNNDVVGNDLTGYIAFWAKMGFKDPKNYLEAFMLNTLGFWYPGKTYPDPYMYHQLVDYSMLDTERYGDGQYITVKRISLLPPYERLFYRLIKEYGWRNIPVLAILAFGATYFLTFLFMVGAIIVRKNWKLLLPASLIFGFVVTLLLSPIVFVRYYFPLILILPIMLSIILKELKRAKA